MAEFYHQNPRFLQLFSSIRNPFFQKLLLFLLLKECHQTLQFVKFFSSKLVYISPFGRMKHISLTFYRSTLEKAYKLDKTILNFDLGFIMAMASVEFFHRSFPPSKKSRKHSYSNAYSHNLFYYTIFWILCQLFKKQIRKF